MLLREIATLELRGFLGRIEKQRPASQLRHLRQLSVCLTKTIDEGKNYLDTNPLPALIKAQRLKAPKRGKAPFEDGTRGR